jgi:sigma-B regulation protein RsbU (phosphoserine phosphatase)
VNEAPGKFTNKKFTVLAVDDTPENLDVVRGILAPEYVVKVAINGPMALKIVQQQQPDLILLDIMMPDMDGFEVCRILKSDPETREVPVIFLTAMDQTLDEASGFELGAADYITKPVNPPILQARVKTHLALKRNMDELQAAYGIIKRQKDRMAEELNIGRDIQMSMLPLEFPAFPDRHDMSVYALLQAAREVGGDFYDFFFVNDDEICLVVGDVSGKGVPAALFMAVTRTIIKTRAMDERSPAAILSRVNDEMSVDNPSCMFVTCFIAMCNVRTGECRYANAGHNPPYILRSTGELEKLDQRHGPVIGALDGIVYSETSTTIYPGDMAYIYTDGVTEAMNSDGQLFSEDRLEGFLAENAHPATKALAMDSLASVEQFAAGAEQADDITILAFCLNESAGKTMDDQVQFTLEPEFKEIEKVNDQLDDFAGTKGVPVEIIQKIKIALDELITNIISHGLDGQGEHTIGIVFSYSPERLIVEISDGGVPFNPLEMVKPDTTLSVDDREIGGLGVFLVGELMDAVEYERRDDSNAVKLTMNLIH